MKLNAFLLAVCTLILSQQGCNTRDPESPSQNVSTFYPPTSYEIVLKNLQYAITEKNLTNYIRCFVDTSVRPYVFSAAEDARGGFADVMNNWNLDAEQRYFRNLKEVINGMPSLTFSDKRLVFVSTDSAIYDLNYILDVPHTRANVPKLMRGNMQLSIGTDSQRRWAIYCWRDSKTTADSTWSYLKAIFSGS